MCKLGSLRPIGPLPSSHFGDVMPQCWVAVQQCRLCKMVHLRHITDLNEALQIVLLWHHCEKLLLEPLFFRVQNKTNI